MISERTQRYFFLSLESAPDILARILANAPASVWDIRPDPQRFSLREMVAHLADWEEIFLERLQRTFVEEHAHLLGIDEGQVAIDRNYSSLEPADSLSRYKAGRKNLMEFLRSVSQEHWARVATHSEIGIVTMEEQYLLIAAHDGYHLRQAVEWTAD